MKLNLTHKVAVIIGASHGIGSACAQELADEGCNLFLVARNFMLLKQKYDELQQQFPNITIHSLAVDAETASGVELIMEKLHIYYSHVDILINSFAGGAFHYQSIDEIDEASWMTAFTGKLLSYIRIVRNVLAVMKQQQSGKIFNILGLSAKEPKKPLVLSGVVNAALANFTKSISKEYAAYNINSYAINPGFIQSERYQKYIKFLSNQLQISKENLENNILNAIPAKRIGVPLDIAKLIVYLSSEYASYINGIAMAVDGGLSNSAF